MHSQYAPDESPAEIWFEQTNNAAVYIGAIAYGVHTVIFFMCAYYIVTGKRTHWKWLPVISILFSMATVNICMNIHFNEMAWIDDRNYPGGPLAFLLEQQANPINTAGNSASFIATFLADGILIYRVHVVWMKRYILVIPVLMWLASAALSILTTIQAARPNSSLWANNTLNFSVPYWSLSIALNLLLTILLISRLLYLRRMILSTPLGHSLGSAYTGVAMVVLESALPYFLVSFVFIVLYGLNNTAANLFIPLLLQVACITPELIILRVAGERAMSSQIITEANLMKSTSRHDDLELATAVMVESRDVKSTTTFKSGSNSHLQGKGSESGIDSVTDAHSQSRFPQAVY
ncbi:hypothetical protein AcV5_001677 [Taiwanofungus camphoratus]|nr:hypothetical protein AcV5_001677 [Antrodia cinnamomea]KAI0933223.1 hypothetical protein AcV7_004753 [Antrodia cinnamomea]